MRVVVEPYHVNNLVSTYLMNYQMNLAVLARQLPVNRTISYLKLWGRVEKNYEKSLEETLHEKSPEETPHEKSLEKTSLKNSVSDMAEIMTHIEKKFTTQCTVTINVPVGKIPTSTAVGKIQTSTAVEEIQPHASKAMNLKIYGNGQIVMTGCRNTEIALSAVKMLTTELKQITTTSCTLHYQVKTCYLFQQLEDFWRQKTKIQASNKAYFVRVKRKFVQQQLAMTRVADYCLAIMTPPLNTGTQGHQAPTEHQSPTGHQAPTGQQTPTGQQVIQALMEAIHLADLEKLNQLLWSQPNLINLRWLKAYEIFKLYLSVDTLATTVDFDRFPITKLICGQLFDFTQTEIIQSFPLSYDPLPEIKLENLTTQNYNIMFQTNLILDLKKTEAYLNQCTDFQASYNPTSKPSIKADYFTAINCLLHTKALSVKNPTCQCKKISCLIFRDRKIIMNGVRNLEQADEAYQILKQFFETYANFINHSVINSKSRVNIPDDQLPDLLRRNSDGQIFLKKSLISDSPVSN